MAVPTPHRFGAVVLFLATVVAVLGAAAGPEVVSNASPADALQALARAGDRVLAVGSKGLVLESEDGGASFTRQAVAGRPAFIDAAACPDERFYLLDFRQGLWARPGMGRAPEAWTRVEVGTAALRGDARLLALSCDPTGTLWAVGEGSAVLRSDDAGATWSRPYADTRDRLLTDVEFLDSHRGFVVGEFGSFITTGDGGVTWQDGPEIPEEFYPHAAAAAPDGRVWVVGNTGLIFRFDPGAGIWSSEASGTEDALYGVARVGDALLTVGTGSRGRSRALAGGPWTPIATRVGTGVARDWRAVLALDATTALLAGNAGLARAVVGTEKVSP